ncbi:MAG: hypothetical protein HYU39_08925 [Thaumarchaeota archaeon]|nr:hypothetical protein [Nitrososphaerota archaeon]
MVLFSPLASIAIQVLDKIVEMAEEDMLLTVGSVRKKMMETQLRYENGEIQEEEYRKDMGNLRRRLEELKSREERT